MSAVPTIYTPLVRPQKAAGAIRLACAATALGCLALLALAAHLRPSPDGVGTHEGLGLEACNFLRTTGLPCPSCGMTTSWSWFTRGNVVASLYIQPMGMVLALLAAAWVWIGLYIALSGRPVYRLMSFIPSRYYLLPLLFLAVLAWGWKIFIHLKGIDGWR